jgi:hypothetical protein
MKIFTIGFTKKSAETFFTRLKEAGVRRLVDVRLNNVSQLAGFTKRDDLEYFTRAICGIEYVHVPELAPTAGILAAYRKQKNGDWQAYEREFLDLMRSRRVEDTAHPLNASRPQARAVMIRAAGGRGRGPLGARWLRVSVCRRGRRAGGTRGSSGH